MALVAGRPVKGKRTTIDKPGTYCLTEDLWVDGSYQPWRWDGPTFFSDDSVVLELKSDDVVVDLQGHAVGSDARLVAAITTGMEPGTAHAPQATGRAFRNVTVRNGVVNPSRGNRAILFADLEPLENVLSDLREGYAARPVDASQAASDEELLRETWNIQIKDRLIRHASDYPVRNLRLEGLKIRSSMPAVVLQGASSVIRDSVIETDSGTALQIHGPNALIENNTIIVHCRKSSPEDRDRSQCLSADAPIRLVNADGAVIRNNRIVLLGSAPKRVISVFQTGAFVFEGNVISGLDDLAQIAAAYGGELSVRQRANRIDNSMASKFKTWF